MTKIGNLANGLRIKERHRKAVLDDGTKEFVDETFEEVVPMRLAKRTTQQVAEIPISLKNEVFDEDGTIIETISNVLDPAALALGQKTPTIETVAAEVHELRGMMISDKCCSSKKKKKGRSFMSMAKAKARHAAPREDIEVRTGSKTEFVVTTIAWVVLAIVGGLLTYSLI